MTTADVLILAVARQDDGLTIVGMTTERDAVTHLRWVRLSPADVPLTLDELRYGDGTLVRPGDVIRLALGAPRRQAPHIESVEIDLAEMPVQRVRRLEGERRSAFFAQHLDPDPADVVRHRHRSLCLVRPDHFHAIACINEDSGEFEARLALRIGKLTSKEEGVPVNDIYWRALMRSWLGDNEFEEWDEEALRGHLGDLYLVLALGRKGLFVAGVHTIPEYEADLDETAL